MNQNKRDFGSFHSSNAEELISLSEEEYVPPQPPFELPSFEEYKSQPPEFGLTTRRKHFYLEDCTFLNHGAMGSVLKEAMEVAQRWQIYTERQPLRTVDRELIPRLVYSTRRMASFINCEPTEIVLVSNVSTALSCVVKSLQFQPGDKIFCLGVTYGALKKLLRHRCKETGAILQEEAISFPIHNKQEIIEIVREKLTSGTKLAVFDHIPSNTPFIMPLEEIIPICKSRGVPVLIDGAHALGSLRLDVRSLEAEFYTANAHKWLCAPKGCAFLYVKRELQDRINPNIVSHGFESGFHSRFIWQGLKDYSSFIALPTVLDFWECVGARKIREYMEDLVRDSANMLVKRWSSGLAAPQTMFKSMSLVRLPESMYVDLENVDYIQAEKIQNTLYHSYNIEVPIKAVGRALYVRISGHIYNQASDYVPLADAILEIAKGR